MRQWYPELAAKREQAALIIKSEEERFLRTLDAGLDRWQEVLAANKRDGIIPGDDLFRLHDTFGFHVELVKELAGEVGVQLDVDGFERAMGEQRERSRKETFISTVAGPAHEGAAESEFVGYDKDEADTEITSFAQLPDGLYEVVVKKSPFYAEMGGQIGDTGRIVGEGFELEVVGTYSKHGVPACRAKLVRGEIAVTRVHAAVDKERRREIERAHTATHLLLAALRKTLGDYVKQEGSLVEPGRLRFDFASFEPMTKEQVHRVERMVYDQVVADRRVQALRETPLDEAKAMGALAFFGDQYGEKVTVVKVGDFSMELCGGTHLKSTGQIGVFRITSETGVAAGIRRIEALVGKAAFERITLERRMIDDLQQKLGVSEDVLVKKVESTYEKERRLESELEAIKAKQAHNAGDALAKAHAARGGVRDVVEHYSDFDVRELRLIADRVREGLRDRYAGFLTCGRIARVNYVIFVSSDLQATLPADKLAKRVSAVMGGGGGGKSDLALGGGELAKRVAGQAEFRKAIQELAGATPA